MPVRAGDLEVVAQLRDEVSGRLDKMEAKAKVSGDKMATSIGGIQNAVNAINLDRAAESVRQFGERSSDVTKVRIAFESVAAQAELSDAKILESAKEATKGLLTEHDIRLNANKALSLGVVENEQDFANLAEAAIILGQKLGVDAGQAVEDLTTGIGRQSVEILDNLGITLRANEAYAIYAERIGKAVKELTDVEKKQAFTTIAIEKATEAARAQGEIIVTTNDKLAIQKNRLQDVADGYAAALGPLAAVGAEMLQLGSQAALVGGVFPGTTAKIGAMGATIGTKLLPVLAGPAGLVLVVGTLLVKALSDASKEVGELDRAAQKMRLQQLQTQFDAVKDKINLANEATFVYKGGLEKLNEEKLRLQTEINEVKVALEAETEATEESTGATEEAAEAVTEVKEEEKDLAAKIEDVNRKWAVQAEEVRGVMSSHYELGNVLRDIGDVLDNSEYGRLEFPGTSKAEAVAAEKVEDALKGAAGSLVTTVAGGTIGGIFNSLASGDWVGAAIQGVSAVWGWLSGRDDEAKERQQAAYDERIRHFEELAEAEVARLDGIREGVVAVGDEMLEWGVITDAWLAELDKLPDHIDSDAIKAKISEGLSELGRLEDVFADLKGLESFVEGFEPESAIEQFVGGERSAENLAAAQAEFVAAGGDAAKFEQFAEALGIRETFDELLARYEDQSLTDEERLLAEQELLAFAEAQGVTGENTVDVIGKTKDLLDAKLGDVAKLLRVDIKGRLAGISANIAAQKKAIVEEINQAAKDIVEAVKDLGKIAAGGGGGGAPGGGKGGDDGAVAMAMGGRFDAGQLLRVGERGEELVRFGQAGAVHPIAAGPTHVTVEIDGEVVARATARHMPDVAYEEGWDG